jgi:hypothetical protein
LIFTRDGVAFTTGGGDEPRTGVGISIWRVLSALAETSTTSPTNEMSTHRRTILEPPSTKSETRRL